MKPSLLLLAIWLGLACAAEAETLPQLYSHQGELLLAHLANAPFPHPQRAQGHKYKEQFYSAAEHYSNDTVAIFIPKGFRETGRIDFVIHFHGWQNDVESVLGRYRLIDQLVASRRNAVLVVPQGPFKAPDSFGGKLEDPEGFARFMNEVADRLRKESTLKQKSFTIGSIILSGHSGGYQVISSILERGGLSGQVKEVWLFDALYARTDKFVSWWDKAHGRLVDLYTEHGGTKDETEQLMSRLKRRGIPFFTGKDVEATPAALRQYRLLFLFSDLPHNDVVDKRNAFETLLATSVLEQLSPTAPSADSDLEFLGGLTRDVVNEARVKPGQRVGSASSNSCGFALLMPGGKGGYPAFWLRDFSMSLDSGFISAEEIRNHLLLIVRCQNGVKARSLRNGLIIPPFAIPDHINFDGSAVFFPGTYQSGEDQGNGTYGILPPVDDQYELVHIAWWLRRLTGQSDFLREPVDGINLYDRLAAAFDEPATDVQTGMVTTDLARRAVGFGFCDGVYLTGKVLFPSLLRYRAAGQMAELSKVLGLRERVGPYTRVQRQIADHLVGTFARADRLGGWLIAATETGRQPDVWGTLYALHLGLLKGAAGRRATTTVVDAVRKQTVVFQGGVRHVPKDLDASLETSWEKTAGIPLNTYQNGAYWHTPTGWLIEAVGRRDRQLAAQVFCDYIQHLREQDFRLGLGHEAPWECFGPKGYAQNGVYMTSVTVPWAVLRGSSAAFLQAR